jgi:hypothetical protein
MSVVSDCGIVGCTEPAQADIRCGRCGLLLCKAHVPTRRRRCADCEGSFTIRNTRSRGWYLAFWLPFLVPWPLYFAVLPQLLDAPWTATVLRSFSIHPAIDSLWLSIFFGTLLGLSGRATRRAVLRRRFMREHLGGREGEGDRSLS